MSLRVDESEPVTVNLAYSSGTATHGVDFTGPATISNPAPYDTNSHSTPLTVVDDALLEGPETGYVHVLPGEGYALGYKQAAKVPLEIGDNDPYVSVLARGELREGQYTSAFFEFSRYYSDAATDVAFTVSGTASDGTDYTMDRTLGLPAGYNNGTGGLTPFVVNDTLPEPTETVTVQITTVNGAAVQPGDESTATLNLLDNDGGNPRPPEDTIDLSIAGDTHGIRFPLSKGTTKGGDGLSSDWFVPVNTDGRQFRDLWLNIGSTQTGRTGTWSLAFPSDKIKVYDASGAGLRPLGSGDQPGTITAPFGIPLVIEALEAAALVKDLALIATFKPDSGKPIRDTIRLTAAGIDLDIDSDNSSLDAAPSRDASEEAVEDQAAGKLVIVNRDDDDRDGILDFADGYGLFPDTTDDDSAQPNRFVPLSLSVPPIEGATLTFDYDYADPADVSRTPISADGLDGVVYTTHEYALGDGLLRIWERPEDGGRTASDVLVPGISYPVESYAGGTQFYVEAVSGSATATAITATLTMPDGAEVSDTIRVLPFDPLVGLDEAQVEGYNILRGSSLSIEGTSTNDIILGTSAPELIDARGGDDIIVGGAGDDHIRLGTGADLIFSWSGSDSITVDSADEISLMEGTVSDGLAVPASLVSGAAAAAAAPRPADLQLHQSLRSGDIKAAYKWMYGDDDLWLRAYEEAGNEVWGTYKHEMGWGSDAYDVTQERLETPSGELDRYFWIVKCQTETKSVLDAAMALRQAILEEVAVKDPQMQEVIQGWLADAGGQVDATTFGAAFTMLDDIRSRQLVYVKESATLAAKLYYDGWIIAGGAGAEFVDAVINLKENVQGIVQLVKTAGELLSLIPGALSGYEEEAPPADHELLDWQPPTGSAAPVTNSSADADDRAAFGAMTAAAVATRGAWLKAAGGALLALRRADVVGPRLTATAASALGFVQRKSTLVSWHPAGTRLVPLVGKAQEVAGNSRHAQVIAEKAQAMAGLGQYLCVGQNVSWRTMFAKTADAGRITANRTRPDIIAVRYDAAQQKYFVDTWEFASANQGEAELMAKMEQGFNSLLGNLPPGVQVARGHFEVVPKAVYAP